MNADEKGHERYPIRPGAAARTLLVRCWIEWDFDSPRLRGTISEVSGEPLGAFETLAGLSALLRKILAHFEGEHRPN